jgi:hypothetical protein
VPDSQTTLWAQKTYGGNYMEVTNVATYGHWLNADGSDIIGCVSDMG